MTEPATPVATETTAVETVERVDGAPRDVTGEASTGPQPPDSTRARRWWLVAALVVGYLLHVGWRLWLARSVSTPVAHADEDRYLLAARALAGGPGGLGNDTTAFRRLGYPLLLSPIYAFTSDPFKVFHSAQAIGALVNALTFPLVYLFGRRVFAVERRLALALAFVVATLPAVAYYSEFALTDAIFAPIGLGWLLLLHGWLTGRTPRSRALAAVGAGAVVGYAYVVHVRGTVLLGIFFVLLAVLALRRTASRALAAASAVTALAVTQLDWVTDHIVGNRLMHGGVEPNKALWARTTTALGIVHTVCDAAGQIWYAGVSTWGLAVIGLVIAVRRIRGRDTGETDRPQVVVLATALAATVLIALSSAAALPNDGRISNHVYPRYIAFLLPIWVLLGAYALVNAGRGRALRLVGVGTAVMGVATFMVLARVTELYSEWYHPFDTPEASFLTMSWRSLPVARAVITALILLGGLAIVLSTRGSWRAVAVGLAAVLLIDVASMEVVNAKSVRPMASREYATAPRLMRDIHIDTHDVVASSHWVSLGARLNHQREVYWASIIEWDTRKDAEPPASATAVVAPYHSRNHDDWDGTRYGWTRAAGDPVQEWAIWLKDSDPRLAEITWGKDK